MDKHMWIVVINNSEDDRVTDFFKINATKDELKTLLMNLQEEAIADDKANFRYGTGSEMEIYEVEDFHTGETSMFIVQAVFGTYTVSWNACREDLLPERQPWKGAPDDEYEEIL